MITSLQAARRDGVRAPWRIMLRYRLDRWSASLSGEAYTISGRSTYRHVLRIGTGATPEEAIAGLTDDLVELQREIP